MKKIYKRPEMSLIALGDEIMDGLTQKSVNPDAILPGQNDGDPTTPIHYGGPSDPSDGGPEAKKGFWDDDYED